MKPRHRAKYRLARTSPGDNTRAVRPLAERVARRDDRGGREIELPIPWKQDIVWHHHPVPLKGFKMADPSPNSPLLKRVVRFPYAMDPMGSKRIQLIDEAFVESRKPGRVRRERPRIVFAMSRAARDRPPAAAPTPVDPRPQPFARQREVADELRWEQAFGGVL